MKQYQHQLLHTVISCVLGYKMAGRAAAYSHTACMGCGTGPPRGQLQGIDHDCNDIPDAAMTLAVAALFAQGQTRIRNVYNWRVKVRFSPAPLGLETPV
jgi:hypothetical protein